MAKLKVNKSEEVRNFVRANPDASNKEIVDAMKKMKIVVSSQMVSTVKSNAGLTKGKKRGRPAKKSVAQRRMTGGSNGHTFAVDLLTDAKKLRVKAGSFDIAIAAIRAIDQIDAIQYKADAEIG